MKIVEKLLGWTDRFLDFALQTPVPARWQEDVEEKERFESMCRHPAGKGLRQGD